jgi:glycosyltransferase involved in cell wall biosynthesis
VNRRLRVAFLLPHLRPGGAERVVVNYLRALDRGRYEPVLFLRRREGAFLDLLPADVPVFDLAGARARHLPRRIAQSLGAHRIDVAYAATDAMNLALLASRWWGARGTDRILSLHTNPAAWLAETKHPRLRRWLMRRLYPRAAVVAVPTEAIGEELREIVAPHTVPIHRLPNPLVERIAKPRVAEGTRIVAAGRLVEAKGFDILIDAAGRLRRRGLNFELAIFGEGPLRGVLSGRIGELGLAEHATLPGHADAPERIFEDATLCVVPSRREGFGNVVVEAMAAGVPVLAAACAGPAALIDHGRNGFLVEPRAPEALAASIAALLADPERRASVIPAGHETARRYEVAAATRAFEAMLAGLVR